MRDDLSKWPLIDLSDELGEKIIILESDNIEESLLKCEFIHSIKDICEEILERMEELL